MSPASEYDTILIKNIRSGDESAWNELIARFEGRLLAYVFSRIGNRAASEDVVQDSFIGFLNSLPNFDVTRPLEAYLFSIAAHKLTDHLRREGRRPTIPLSGSSTGDENSQWDLPGRMRVASSIARSGERRGLENSALAGALRDEIIKWRGRGDWTKMKCLEMLFVRGAANKHVATTINITEQQVANYKSDFISRLQNLMRRQGLPEDVFPQLYEE